MAARKMKSWGYLSKKNWLWIEFKSSLATNRKKRQNFRLITITFDNLGLLSIIFGKIKFHRNSKILVERTKLGTSTNILGNANSRTPKSGSIK